MVHKVSKHQRQLIKKMEEQGAILDCNEGKSYKAWLRYPDGTKETVRRDTVENLSEKEAFKGYGTAEGLALNPYFHYEKK